MKDLTLEIGQGRPRVDRGFFGRALNRRSVASEALSPSVTSPLSPHATATRASIRTMLTIRHADERGVFIRSFLHRNRSGSRFKRASATEKPTDVTLPANRTPQVNSR